MTNGGGESAPGRVPLVDTHCHLDLQQFDRDREEVVARAEAAGVRILINPGINLDSCAQVLALAERYSGLYAAVGIHPNDCEDFDERALAALRQMAGHPKVVAIGEIGLDFYRKRVSADRQKHALQAQLALAAELGLPVILHSRESNRELLCEMAQWGPEIRKKRGATAIIGVWHAFSGDLDQAQVAYGLGLVLGLGGPVTFSNARRLRAQVAQLRADRLLLETDAPYLAPHPFRGQRNEPAYVPLIARAVAELSAQPVETIAAGTTATALACFDRIARRDQ